MPRKWTTWQTRVLGVLLASATGGCTVMSIDQAAAVRARDGSSYDANREAAALWQAKALPYFRQRAVALDALIAAARRDFGTTRGRHGRQAAEGSDWIFIVSGSGRIRRIEHHGPRGRLVLDTAQGPVVLQTGPLISGTAIRDALPFVHFDDAPDQIAYANLARALTMQALDPIKPLLAALRPGDRIRFLAAASSDGSEDLRNFTPVTVGRDTSL